jgi:sec-independent protein translocase protein TatA
MFGLRTPELLVILVVVLLLFGGSRLPTLGKSLGSAMRGFKKSLSEDEPEALPPGRSDDQHKA